MSEKKEYIERGALIAFVREVRKNLPKESKDFFTRDEMLLNFQQYVELRPAAYVSPVVHGEWIESEWRPKCSVCGHTGSIFDSPTSPFNFCPNCGARMVEHGKERER